METIIGLLIVILPIVFKLIEKRLEKAAQTPAQTGPSDADIAQDWIETVRQYAAREQEKLAAKPVPEETPKAENVPVRRKTKAKARPILLEEEPVQKEKIDVKKMIVYSEIMKPKYKE